VAVVVHGMVDLPYFKNDLSLEFWTLLGLAWAGRLWSVAQPQPAPAAPAQTLARASISSV